MQKRNRVVRPGLAFSPEKVGNPPSAELLGYGQWNGGPIDFRPLPVSIALQREGGEENGPFRTEKRA
jgi:hypothetical protein